MSTERVGILVSRDLMFTTKVTSTARSLSARVLVAGDATLAASMITQWSPSVVLIDLNAGPAATPEAIVAYRSAMAGVGAIVAFGSHVDTAALAAASAAGCDEVMPRSKFSAELPALLERHLSVQMNKS